jgi:hypothetical protein
MERLSETYEWGSALAELIRLAGWTLHEPVSAFGGGLLFIATRVDETGRVLEVKRTGAAFVDVATDMFSAVHAPFPPSPLPAVELVDDVQLQIHVPAA